MIAEPVITQAPPAPVMAEAEELVEAPKAKKSKKASKKFSLFG
jgi:hypothetical protein